MKTTRTYSLVILAISLINILQVFAVDIISSNPIKYKKEGSEYSILTDSIYSQKLDHAIPNGPVDVNPPCLAYNPWGEISAGLSKLEKRQLMGDKKKKKLQRRYFFELSQDKNFKKKVIKSKPLGWSFFNPHQKLTLGTWYWRVSFVDKVNKTAVFDGPVYSFIISGKERVFVPPSSEEMIKIIKKTPSPRVIMPKSLIGKLDDFISQENSATFKKDIDRALKLKIVAYQQRINLQAKGRSEKTMIKLASKKANHIVGGYCSSVNTLIRAHLISGEKKYKELALGRFKKLIEMYDDLYQFYPRGNKIGEWAVNCYFDSALLILDACGDEIDEQLKKACVKLTLDKIIEGSGNYENHLAQAEYLIYKAHLWQSEVVKPMLGAIVLLPYVKDAETWFKYYYDLWLFRSPAGSRNDGGWHAGLLYFGVNTKPLLRSAWVLYQLSGFDYFNQPWYKNVSKFVSFASPKGTPRSKFGDFTSYDGGSRSAINSQQSLSEILLHFQPDNYWHNWRVSGLRNDPGALKKSKKLSPILDIKRWYGLVAAAHFNKKPLIKKQNPPKKSQQAALFRDIGYVGASSNMADPSDNMHLTFRSCPFGAINHSMPAQNAFNLSFGGESIFITTGSRHAPIPHKAFDYENSRAHNTIVPDGITQSTQVGGFGWIPRFVHGEDYTYFSGDASNAYSGGYDYLPLNELQPFINGEGGLHSTSVERFRRHMLVLRPNIVIIYDELKSKTPYDWRLKFHSLNKMVNTGSRGILTENNQAKTSLHVWGSDKTKTNITDQFRFPAIQVRKESKASGELHKFKNSWHTTISLGKRATSYRYLSIIQVNPKNGKIQTITPQRTGKDTFELGSYTIKCHLDTNKPSLLSVTKKDGSFGLSTGQACTELKVGGKIFKSQIKGSTIFYEKTPSKTYQEVLQDTLPDSMVYGNIY